MGITTYPQGFTPAMVFFDPRTGRLTQDAVYLLLSLLNRTGQQAGAPLIQTDLTVISGETFGITADWNVFSTVPSGGVAQIPPLTAGADCIVWNFGANPLSVTPQPGIQIDTLGAGAGYSLAINKMQWFRCVSMSQIYSMQLG